MEPIINTGTAAGPVSILLADDHQMILDGLKGLLSASEKYIVTNTALNGQRAMEMIDLTPGAYDVLVTDISMPLLSGTDLCRMVKAAHPHIAVLVLSMYSSPAAVEDAIMAEADGYILKNAGRAELMAALDRITSGGTYYAEEVLPILHNHYRRATAEVAARAMLSTRELEILALLLLEKTSEEIGETLFISKKTVDNHRTHMLEKTGCRSTIGLVMWAVRNGLAGG